MSLNLSGASQESPGTRPPSCNTPRQLTKYSLIVFCRCFKQMFLNRKVSNKFDVDIYTKFIHKHNLITHKHTFSKYCQMSLQIFLSNKAQFQCVKKFQILYYKSVTMLMSSYVPQLEAKNRVLLCHESDIFVINQYKASE